MNEELKKCAQRVSYSKTNLPDEKIEAEIERILDMLWHKEWIDPEALPMPFGWFEFDTDDRELTRKALAELIRLIACPEEKEGLCCGFPLFGGFSIDKNNHCILYVKLSKAEATMLECFLMDKYEGKK